jgi:hypothetical protein
MPTLRATRRYGHREAETSGGTTASKSRENAMGINRVSEMLGRFGRRCRHFFNQRRVINGSPGCAPNELMCTISDVGLRGDDMKQLFRSDFGPLELLPQRSHLLGIDPMAKQEQQQNACR